MIVYDLAPSAMVFVSSAELLDHRLDLESLTYTQALGFLRPALKASGISLPEFAGLRVFQSDRGALLFLFPPCSSGSLTMASAGTIYA